MIPQSRADVIFADWQDEVSQAVNDPAILLQLLGLEDKLATLDPQALKQFPLRATHSYIRKMRYGDAEDPLLRQVFPLIDESIQVAGFSADPVGDHLAIKSPGILHKYRGRALLLTTGACAIHCRYCFRRHFPYSDSNPLASQWQRSLDVLRNDPSIQEIILSGGDPLALTDSKLIAMMEDLQNIPHIKRLRIHSRLPLVVPSRITERLVSWFSASHLQIVMVIHANHANEIDNETAEALARLRRAGCLLLNQAVLLKGVNNSAQALIELSERLADADVLPYYLHLLDKVAGASHFDVDEQQGIAFIAAMRRELPGYLVPRLVREQQGEASKTLIA